MQKHFEKLLRADYKGKLYVRHTFVANEKMPLKLMIEKGRFFTVLLNGKPLQLQKSDFDFNFLEADISDFVQVGENEFLYGVDYYHHDGVHFALFDPQATESLRNCLYYDTHIENIYIKGDFVVNSDLSLSPRKKFPNITTENDRNGYPFFMGNMTLDGEYAYDGRGARVLTLLGRYQTAELTVNGQKTDMTMSERKDITSYLQKGSNQIRIVVYSSLRNLFGPHHCKREIEERSGIGPWAFTMRGRWADGDPDIYTEQHVSVPFGVSKIEISEELD